MFGRIGGKSKIAEELINMFPDPETYKTYVEPFIGAGNILFRKLMYEHQHEVINDLDDNVFIIFEGVKKEGSMLETLKPIPYPTKEEWKEFKKDKHWIKQLICHKTSFLGTGDRWTTPERRGGKLRPPIKTTLTNSKLNLNQERLKNVTILHKDFTEVINEYNEPDTFFYFDPPYEKSKDYSNSVKPQDVYDAVSKIKGKFMLSYNDSENIRELFKQYKIKEIKTLYNLLSKKQEKTELVITNY
jgi:DNA adenine methylase